MERPCITIDLPHYLQDFLFHEFKQEGEERLVANGTSDIGKMIQSMITVSDRPRKLEIKDEPLVVYLPVQAWNHILFQENFIYIPEWKQAQLKLFIEAQFRLRLKEFFHTGYEKGYKQDRIIMAFLTHYNIKHNSLNYDMIKKYDYRHRRKLKKEIANELAQSSGF